MANNICFVVEGTKIRVARSALGDGCAYISRLLSEAYEDDTELRLILPSWVMIGPFQQFLQALEQP